MNIVLRLKLVSFLQFFIWGSWLVTFASYLFGELHFKGSDVGLIFSALGLASLIAPVIMGFIADKINNRKLVFITLHILSALALVLMSQMTTVTTLFFATLLHLLFFMPSISMANSIIFELLEQKHLEPNNYFPKIRVYGTVGFIAAMWVISFLGLGNSYHQLFVAAIASIVLAVFAMFLPATKAADKNETKAEEKAEEVAFSITNILQVFKKKNVVVFLFFATLLGSVLQITNTFGVPFLQDIAQSPNADDSFFARYPSVFLSISQISEVVFILFLPLLLKRVRIETIVLFSMIAWILRFGFFAYGDYTSLGQIVLLLSMIVYGCAFDFFNISGSLFLEKEIPLQYRSTAQGMFMTLVNGFGTYLGAMLSGWVIDLYTTNGAVDWKSFWLIFTGYTVAITALYLIFLLIPQKKAKVAEAN
ncbi:MFS transporter [Proteus terrae]|uniref:MFS transporter n=1 Tax=Proteus terrae TaxID=1574161 RepID=UPI0013DFDB69|nr:MFS transporter [Proteus terrae]QIF98438.1 MFS transporter [Proteus terrae subsp. cibarius]